MNLSFIIEELILKYRDDDPELIDETTRYLRDYEDMEAKILRFKALYKSALETNVKLQNTRDNLIKKFNKFLIDAED
jgi:hypothetical protein